MPERGGLFHGMWTRWAVVVLAVGVAVAGLLPPGTASDDVELDQFSAARAFRHVEVIAQRPHPMGSPELEQVRAYILDELKALGLSPETQSVTSQDYFGSPSGTVEVVTILAKLPGTASSGAVALVAHYDSALLTPGANDNASAIGALLETARVLLSEGPRRNDVILLFTDGEEPQPRPGSRAFLEHHRWFEEIGLVVNFEANGGSGPSMLVDRSGPGSWVIPEFANAVPRPVAASFSAGIVDLLGTVGTDFDLFKERGVPGLSFAYMRGSGIYHTMDDAPAAVDLRSLSHHGENALSVARHFGDIDLADPKGEAMVYFSILGRLLVRHPANWMLPTSILAGLLLGAGFEVARRRSPTTYSAMARGTGVVLVVTLLASLLGFGLWKVIIGARTTVGVVESYLYLTGLIGLTVAGVGWLFWRFGNRPRLDLERGSLILWWLFAVAGAALVPLIGYLFVWPCLAAATATLWKELSPAGPWPSIGRLGLVAFPAVLITVPAIDLFFLFAQPRPGNPDSLLVEAVSLSVLFVAMVTALLLPHFRDLPENRTVR